MSDIVVPSVESLPVHSPLESLLRRTSNRRRPNITETPLPQDGMDHYPPASILDAPPKPHTGLPPSSPLLHTRFRASIATQSSSNSYGLRRSHVANRSQDTSYDDDTSVYSVDMISFPNSGPTSEHEDIAGSSSKDNSRHLIQRTSPRPPSDTLDVTNEHILRHSTDSATDTFMYDPSWTQNSSAIPTVVVSAEEFNEAADDYEHGKENALSNPGSSSLWFAGRTPSAIPSNVNFSRPVRPGGASEDAKRQVLARNAFRSTSTHSSLQPSVQPQPYSSPHRTEESSQLEATQSASTKIPVSPSKSSSSPSPSPMPPTRSPSDPRATAGSGQPVPLLHKTPSASSLNSLYSTYSYYQLDSPSPTTDTLQVPPSPQTTPPHTPSPRTPSPLNPTPAPKGDPEQLVLADRLLQEGIQHHEANRLKEAAAAFEKCAKVPGGSGIGMLMWGLTLRHGWGCPKDEVLGFSWLRRAAEAAVGDLEHARTGIDTSVVRDELVLAMLRAIGCGLNSFSPIFKSQQSLVIWMHNRSLHSAMLMAAVVGRTAGRQPSGTVQL